MSTSWVYFCPQWIEVKGVGSQDGGVERGREGRLNGEGGKGVDWEEDQEWMERQSSPLQGEN